MDKDFIDYKNVLIVGNGFDLNIGLKTSYSDYIKGKEFQSLLGKNNLADYLNLCSKTSKWVDIEKELYKYSVKLFYKIGERFEPNLNKRELIGKLKSEYNEICYSLKLYLERVTSCKINIDKTASFYIINKVFNEKDINTYILTFNYTDIIERIQQTLLYSINNYYINHIHGSLQNNNIVFGIEDSVEVAKEHVFLYKSYNNQNINGLISILKNAENITFFCYSLGETDHSYFDDFFSEQTKPNCDRKNFAFYYYGQEAYDDLIWQLKTLTKNRLTYLKQYNQLEFHDVSSFR